MRQSRGYALVFVLVFGVVLASLSSIILLATSRDSTEAHQQTSSVRALYAAEGGVSTGIGLVSKAMRDTPTPDLSALAVTAKGQLAVALPGADFSPAYSIKYFDAQTGVATLAPPSPAPPPSTITAARSPYRGMVATQLPIQVLATARVDQARATIADAISVNLIPIFQFAVFMDGPVEYFKPEASQVTGRVHSNTGIFFGPGADDITFLKPSLTTAGAIHLRQIDTVGSQTSGRAPRLDVNGDGVFGGGDITLPCDNAASGAVGCPGGASWLTHTSSALPFLRDAAHGVAKLKLPTGVDDATFTQKVVGVPDTCGIVESTGAFTSTPGAGVPLSPDWLLIDLPRAGDSPALVDIKYAHRAGIRVVDGVWERRNAGGSYDPWFRQSDPGTPESQCVYYGYNPSSDAGAALGTSDGVPAVQDIRFWDHQDRRMRRVQVVDVRRLTGCLPFLDTLGFNGILYFGESLDATTDNWGLAPDARFYELTGGSCNANFQKLPHYLRGQVSTAYGFTAPRPRYLNNDDVDAAANPSGPLLDNPYYPVTSFCSPKAGDATRVKGLGDGPLRLPQGNGNGVVEPGRNELVESGVLVRNAQRLPNVVRADGNARGFTFATNAPLYLQGDINIRVGTFSAASAGYTFGKVPSSFAGDATTFLSDKFNTLQENPFAPVGPLAGVRAITDTGGVTTDAQRVVNANRVWQSLDLGRVAPTGIDAARFDFDTANGSSANAGAISPAPCVNLLRELALRRPLVSGGLLPVASVACGGGNCGYDTVFRVFPSGTLNHAADGTLLPPRATLAARDWSMDLGPSPSRLFYDADRDGLDSASERLITGVGTMGEFRRLANAYVAFAPLESFLDVGLYQVTDPASTSFANANELPTGRVNREALRDWMRCTLNSEHVLADVNPAAPVDAIRFGGVLKPAVIIPGQLEVGAASAAADAPIAGMKVGSPVTGATPAFDLTWQNFLGSSGWAPLDPNDTTSVFRTAGGATFFSRDRSGLRDAAQGTPVQIDDDLGNLAAASVGDQLALNTSILTGTTWRCPNEMPYPNFGANHPRNDSLSALGTKNANWALASIDEGVYGIFRYQESWFSLDRASSSSSSGNYIDFFVNGSVVTMFYSREANGKHLLNQGFMSNMNTGGDCGGQDNNQRKNRNCRLAPGFEYAWESSVRSIKYDPDNNLPAGMPPGTPNVVATDRLRWVRR